MSSDYAVLLVRVSTYGQNTKPQKMDLIKWAASRGYPVKKQHIIETKESGLADMITKVGVNDLFRFLEKNPNYRTVIATEISRLGRRQAVLHAIKEYLIKNKIQLICKDTDYRLLDDTGVPNPTGEAMFTLYGLFAENEIKTKQARFLRARIQNMAQGIAIAGRMLFGYSLSKDSRGRSIGIIPNPETSKFVAEIFQRYLTEETSVKKLAIDAIRKGYPKYLHSKRNLNKLLKEEGYLGSKVTNNKRRYKNLETGEVQIRHTSNQLKFPPLISKELFEAVQDKLRKNNTSVNKAHKHITLLSRLIECPNCKNHFMAEYKFISKLDRSIYRCSSRSRAKGCSNKMSISLTLLNSVVWSIIKSDFESLKTMYIQENPHEVILQLESANEIIKKRVGELDVEISKLINSLDDWKDVSGTAAFFQKVKKKMTQLERAKATYLKELDYNEVKLLEFEREKSEINYEAKFESHAEIKKYINLFVQKIHIIFHNQRFSVILIEFKGDSASFQKKKRDPRVEPSISKFTTIILDKKVTRRIQAFKITAYAQRRGNSILVPAGQIKVGTKSKVNWSRIDLNKLSTEHPKLDLIKIGTAKV
jgi:DNA invertase Pin-like site-specific DNA recombinase